MKRISTFLLLGFLLAYTTSRSQDTTISQVSTTSHAAKAKAANFPVKTASTEAQNNFDEGLYWFELGDIRKAKPFLQKAIDLDPNLAAAHTIQAMTWRTTEGFARSLQQAKAHLSTASEWERLYYGIIETFLTEDLDKRLSLSEQMVTQFPDNARSYYELGNTYTARRETNKAREQYKKAIELAPTWIVGYDAMSNSFLNEEPQDPAQATTYAQKMIELVPTSAQPHVLLGDTYRAQNKWEEARASYTKAIELDPTTANAYYKRGHVTNFAGNYEAARKDYVLAAKYDEDTYAQALGFAAFTYAYQNDLQKALQMLLAEDAKLKESFTKNKEEQQFILLQAAAHIAYHKKDAKALAAVIDRWEPVYEAIAKQAGTDEYLRAQKADMLYWKGMVQVLNGNYSAAMANAAEIKKTLDPIKSPRKLEGYHSLMGHVYFRQNDYKQAVTHLNQTNKTDTYNKYWKAKANENMGQKDKALQLYQELANYNFNDVGNALVRSEVKKKVSKR